MKATVKRSAERHGSVAFLQVFTAALTPLGMRDMKEMFTGKVPTGGRLKTSLKYPSAAVTNPAEKLTTRIASTIKTKLRLPSKVPSRTLGSSSELDKAVPLASGGAMRLKASKIPRLASDTSPRGDDASSSSFSTVTSEESPFSSPRSRIPVLQSSKTRRQRERNTRKLQATPSASPQVNVAAALQQRESRPEQRIEILLAADSHIEAVSIGDEGNPPPWRADLLLLFLCSAVGIRFARFDCSAFCYPTLHRILNVTDNDVLCYSRR